MSDTVKNLRTKAADYNPRKITPIQEDRLGKSMSEYGDISGIVRNIRTDRLVGGHQRVKKLDASWPVVIKDRAKKGEFLDSTGTVARGYIDTPVGQWTYREVDWDEKKEKAANIAANASGGDFDHPKLAELVQDLDKQKVDLTLLGLDDTDIAGMLERDDKVELKDVAARTTKTVWALIGVPLGDYPKVADLVEKAGKIEGAIVEVSANGI